MMEKIPFLQTATEKLTPRGIYSPKMRGIFQKAAADIGILIKLLPNTVDYTIHPADKGDEIEVELWTPGGDMSKFWEKVGELEAAQKAG